MNPRDQRPAADGGVPVERSGDSTVVRLPGAVVTVSFGAPPPRRPVRAVATDAAALDQAGALIQNIVDARLFPELLEPSRLAAWRRDGAAPPETLQDAAWYYDAHREERALFGNAAEAGLPLVTSLAAGVDVIVESAGGPAPLAPEHWPLARLQALRQDLDALEIRLRGGGPLPAAAE
jgi:hypothetical protein